MWRPMLKPYLKIYKDGNDDKLIVYGHAEQIWEIEGASVVDLVDLLPHINGINTMEQAAEAAGKAPELVEEIIYYLKDQGMLWNQEADCAFEDLEMSLNGHEIFLSRYLDLRQVKSLQEVKIAIVEKCPQWKYDLIEGLKKIGVKNIQEFDDITSITGTYHLAVIMDSGLNGQLFIEAEERFKESGTPWMKISVFNEEIGVGPIFIPDATACYKCYKQRFLSNRKNPEYAVRLFNDSVKSRVDPIANSYGGAGQLIGGYGSLEILKFFTGLPCQIVGAEYSLNVMSLECTLSPVWKVPYCTSCVSSTDKEPKYIMENSFDLAMKGDFLVD
ncbi:TOMM precursor leader peptide-binding protein [Falsibacillus albus]|uniref:TOMM precursor leader peptide-binding protein n=1 Tax=Falsibacillus albus TaxID=2478915 RepID=UPI001314019E|nr:TOMM precursor leader peptide-binding protein [Falsibacillus albus]